jgi:hypothetical protein
MRRSEVNRVSGARPPRPLDVVRDTTVGHLVLGSGFDPRDIAAYARGVAAAVLVEAVVRSRSRQASIDG